MSNLKCIIESCTSQRRSAQYCANHYYSFKRYGDPLYKQRVMNQIEWIRRVVQEETDECVIWPHHVVSGYGIVSFNGKPTPAHRAALILFTGQNPAEMHACHGACHNRLCINPRHLSWQTPKQNAADKHRDGTAQVGVNSPRTRLTEMDVAAIRQRRKSGEIYRTIAVDFGISIAAIQRICANTSFHNLLSEID